MAVLLRQPRVPDARTISEHVQAADWAHKLSMRAVGGKVVGDMTVGGFPKNQETFARVSGYVEQTDVHSPLVCPETANLPFQQSCCTGVVRESWMHQLLLELRAARLQPAHG